MIEVETSGNPVKFTYTTDGALVVPFVYNEMRLMAKFDGERIWIVNSSLVDVGRTDWCSDGFGFLMNSTVIMLIESVIQELDLVTGYVVSDGERLYERDLVGTDAYKYKGGALTTKGDAIKEYRSVRRVHWEAGMYHVLFNSTTGTIVSATIYPLF